MNYFVTGGSRGIGAAIVLQAIGEGHGVAFTYLNSETMAREVEKRARELRPDSWCRCYRMDVRDPDEVERVGDQVLEDFETVEVVVNNAAINRDSLALSMSTEQWLDVLATNLNGPFFVCRHFLTGMLPRRFGRIINISSVSAAGNLGQANYAASKAGLTGLTRTLAMEYGPRGITANLVIPGLVDTGMEATPMSDRTSRLWLELCPKRRMGELSEISRVVTFLASEAADFINGAEIPVTGGLDRAV